MVGSSPYWIGTLKKRENLAMHRYVHTHGHTHRHYHMKMKAEIYKTRNTQGCQQTTEAKGEAGNRFFLTVLGRNQPC